MNEDDTGVLLNDLDTGLLFLGYSTVEVEERTFEEQIRAFMSTAAAAAFDNLRVQSQGAVRLADDLTAQSADLSGQTRQGDGIVVRLVYARLGSHSYFFVVVAAPEVLDANAQVLERTFGSIRLAGQAREV